MIGLLFVLAGVLGMVALIILADVLSAPKDDPDLSPSYWNEDEDVEL